MRTLNFLHVCLLAIALAACIYSYGSLPTKIPVRFGFDGSPQGYATRGTLFVIYGIWAATAALLAFVERNPESNTSYAPGLSQAEVEIYRQETSKLLPLLNLLTGVLMFVVLAVIIYAGLREQHLSRAFGVVLIGYLVAVGWLVIRTVRRAKILAKR